jgi:hypothetical protein
MATTLTVNGSSFSFPTVNDLNWGTNVTNWATAVSQSTLQKNGGSFTLTAEVDFGGTAGLKALYLSSRAANLPSTGVLRFGNAEEINFRNAANNGNVTLTVNASDRFTIGGVAVPTISSTDTLTNKTLTSPVITSPTGLVKADVGLGNVDNTSDLNKPISTATQTALDLKANLVNPTFDDGITMLHESTPSTPSSGRVRVYPKSDNTLYVLDSSGIETPVGSGTAAGFINYITNADAQSGTTGWATYADAAAATPADGTGGSPNVTWTRNTTSPLRGAADFAFAKDAANRQGQGVAFAFTISTTDRSKKCQITFDYDTSTTNYAAGDMRVYVYDVTNATLITPQTVDIPKGTNTFVTTFDTTTSTSYRLILHVATTNATAYTVDFDNFVVNAGQVVQGAAISEWESWTPTGSWTANTTYTGRWKRDGSDMLVRVQVATSGVPTAAALTVNLPNGHTINTTALVNTTSSNKPILGIASSYDGTSSTYPGWVTYNNTTSLAVFQFGAASSFVDATTGTQSGVAPFTFGSGDGVLLEARIPIAEWAGSGTVNLGPGAQVEFASVGGTWDANSTTTVYGPQGVQITGALTDTRTKTITWQYPIQSDDMIVVEGSSDGLRWWPMVQNYPYSLNSTGSNSLSAGVFISSQTATTTVVQFCRYAALANDDSPAFDWGTTVWWRVRKAKSSSPVGFGLATATDSGLVNPYNTSNGVVYAGTYTPMLTNGTNVSANSAFSCQYLRVGNIVTVSGQCNITTTSATNTRSVFFVSLPIASNLASVRDLSGTFIRLATSGTANSPGIIYADTVNDRAEVAFNSTEAASNGCGFTFQYQII